ncbi:hypothetical protein TRIATDRAFT_299050 [Trichoderma atroviride IMI 206040]|uniref:Uncharacterized protein n=1 Tax=Hypocrea atroviridis (strain ATCC 20476 / IMI 206040) TaxID=452589 RepID=G9NSH5_HYPAI|nr:uncharacterized protein TRIATDRAFT_299050 [Trichoderma atroviride IMI 206040]EHK46374.1 hypothetical protein TRIATDRAFT_299050 [Trichoderma atroviride IMI 206040]
MVYARTATLVKKLKAYMELAVKPTMRNEDHCPKWPYRAYRQVQTVLLIAKS